MDNNTIYHHGILGMHWGVRKGPPYPLSGAAHTPSEKRAGTKGWTREAKNEVKTYKSSKSNVEVNKKKGLSDKQKTALKVGAVAAGVALAAIGGYALYKSGKLDDLVLKGRKLVPKNLQSAGNGLDRFNKITKNLSLDDNIEAVNPNWKLPTFFMNAKTKATNFNCGNCMLTLEARLRGYDVTALGNSNGMTVSNLGKYLSGFNSKSFTTIDVPSELDIVNNPLMSNHERGKKIESLIKTNILNSYGSEDARGGLFVPKTTGSHWVSWVKNGNDVTFIDSQPEAGIVDMVDDVFGNYIYHRNNADAALQTVRLDNLDFTNNISEVMKNASNKLKIKDLEPFTDFGENFVVKRKI